MTDLKRLLSILTALLLIAACGDDGDDFFGNNAGTNNAAAETDALVTYNVGLARGFVDYAAERVQPVAEAVAALDADVVCLQEAWIHQDDEGNWVDDQITTIIAEASESFPHSYWERTVAPDEAKVGCSTEEADPLQACVEQNCAEVAPGELAGCALSNCGTEFNATSTECQTCIAGELGNPLDDIIATCTGDGSSSYSYDGHNGLLLLSKHPLTNTEYVDLPAVLVWRSVLHATVELPDVGPTDVYCTHLTADLSNSIAYPGDGTYESYEEEQTGQIVALTSWMGETAQTEQIALMGDLNTSPAVASAGVAAEFPENYSLLLDAGFTSLYPTLEDTACTYCLDNPLIEAGEAGGKILDHVLVQGLEAVAATRIFDTPQAIATSDGELELPPSDHYGVRVLVEDRP